MKNILLISLILVSCNYYPKNSIGNKINNANTSDLYKISKIDSINSYYVIYINQQDEIYKIISKKENTSHKFDIIKKNRYYRFKLINFPEYDNNDSLTGFSSIQPCFMLDPNTQVCKEKEVAGLYTTKNLKGLYYVDSNM